MTGYGSPISEAMRLKLVAGQRARRERERLEKNIMVDFIHSPENTRTLDDIYVFCSVDDEGKRGIVANIIPGLGGVTYVTGSPDALEYMKRMAPIIAKDTGKRIVLYRYQRCEELEEFKP